MKIEKVGKDRIFLRIKIGDGTFGDEKFAVSLLANGGGMLVEFEDDDKYLISTEEVIKEVMKLRGKK